MRALRERICAHPITGRCAAALADRLRTMLMGTGLAILMCFTTWVIASVWPWIAPGYLILMVLIFVTPRNRHRSLVPFWRSAGPAGNPERDRDPNWSTPGSGEAASTPPGAQPFAEAAADELAVAGTDSSSEPAGADPGKQWRGRTRVRKTSKAPTEAASHVPPVAWIRVGPGKFVRADNTTHSIAQVEPRTPLHPPDAGGKPHADSSASAVQAPTEAALSAAEQPGCKPPQSNQSNPGNVVGPSDEIVRSATAEHGIAPSALGSVVPGLVVAHGLEDEAPDALVEPAVAPAQAPPPGEKAPDCDAGFVSTRLLAQAIRAGARRVLRGFTGPMRAPQRSCQRYAGGTRWKLRTSVWSLVGANRPLQQLGRRVCGRAFQSQRALQPRSPPCSKAGTDMPASRATAQSNPTLFDPPPEPTLQPAAPIP